MKKNVKSSESLPTASRRKWIFTAEVYEEIRNTIGRKAPEWGGMLGSSDGKHIDHYYFDQNAERNCASYTMNTDDLNRVIHEWNDRDVRLIGIIHSHPNGVTSPSCGDIQTAKHIIESMDVSGEFFTPIVQVSPKLNGEIKIYPYTFEQNVVMLDTSIEIDRTTPEERELERRKAIAAKAPDRFKRISSIFPDDLMAKKKVICIGCGGSRAFLESLARCGVGNFILIDGDQVEDTNIATQGTYISEIGRYKAEVIRDRILDINPLANVTCINRYLDDSVSDTAFAKAADLKHSATADTLICGCTDNFFAQDRAAQLSVKYRIPYLAAQIFAGGIGHEVLFWYPKLTPSCPRCMLETRYKKLLTETQKPTGSSAGAAVCVTDYLNAIKEYVAISILCYAEQATPYYHALDQFANNNYLMTRCSDALCAPAFDPVNELCVKEPDLLFPYMTVAIGQTPEKDCPLCKGSFDGKKTKITDTRIMPNPYTDDTQRKEA